MLTTIRTSLSAFYDPSLVNELLAAYQEAKRRHQSGDLRPSAIEGGRFCEAALRMLEQRASGIFTPLGTAFNIDESIRRLAQTAKDSHPASVRLHIPRALRLVYDIRNNRDAAHLADGIDPNLQDATLVIGVLDWVLAEFVRLHHNVSADRAQQIVRDLVVRQVSAIQDFEGFPKLLKKSPYAINDVLVLLYRRGAAGAFWHELYRWLDPNKRRQLQEALDKLVNEQAYVHFHEADGRFQITVTGQQFVEQQRLLG